MTQAGSLGAWHPVVVEVELLYFEGCPGHRVVRRRLRALLAEAGVNARVRERRVNTDGDARRERFLGSPTLRVNGVDIDPNAADLPTVSSQVVPLDQLASVLPPGTVYATTQDRLN